MPPSTAQMITRLANICKVLGERIALVEDRLDVLEGVLSLVITQEAQAMSDILAQQQQLDATLQQILDLEATDQAAVAATITGMQQAIASLQAKVSTQAPQLDLSKEIAMSQQAVATLQALQASLAPATPAPTPDPAASPAPAVTDTSAPPA